ncbi:uncharacterized protein SPSK_01922 [Sporothrix schenckii 1099-18]|uniref:Uncharacterized protein n=1 Tax=Sporothrix schenckii 1099-18 TaxID=1397361 RepID=A0A0F2MCU0_SPOSC|nr:uncharacterized protein SPSK_01922 [Sporothrix schenckii 1099-18]KJR87498.1 hypothetical protein SPSK_01922 [Sporothrix schenckii 1099-18]
MGGMPTGFLFIKVRKTELSIGLAGYLNPTSPALRTSNVASKSSLNTAKSVTNGHDRRKCRKDRMETCHSASFTNKQLVRICCWDGSRTSLVIFVVAAARHNGDDPDDGDILGMVMVPVSPDKTGQKPRGGSLLTSKMMCLPRKRHLQSILVAKQGGNTEYKAEFPSAEPGPPCPRRHFPRLHGIDERRTTNDNDL